MADDVWKSAGDAPVPSELPPIMETVNEVIADLQANFMGYFLAGIGFALTMIPLIIVMYVLIFVPMIPGLIAENDTLIGLGVLVGSLLGIGGLIATIGPLQAGLYRAVWRNITESEPLSFGSAFSNAFEDAGSSIALTLMIGLLVMIGLPFCYVGALFASFATCFAMPAFIAHKVGPVGAIQFSIRHAIAHPGWHAAIWGISFVCGMLAGNIPIVGMVALVANIAIQMRLYRKAFGDNPPVV